MARPKSDALPSEYVPRIAVLEDGSIKNRRTERFALFLSDGLVQADAWHVARKEEAGARISYVYLKRVLDDSAFKKRLRDLVEEKEELMAQDPYGPLIWQARQGYRHAVAKDDHKEMRANTELAMKLMESQRAAGGGDGPRPDQMPSGKVGKPAADAPNTPSTPSQFKALLRAKGVEVQVTVEPEDAVDAA